MYKVATPKKTPPPRIRIFRFSEGNFSMEHRFLYIMLQEIVTVCSGLSSLGLCLRYVLLTPTLPIYPPLSLYKRKVYPPCFRAIADTMPGTPHTSVPCFLDDTESPLACDLIQVAARDIFLRLCRFENGNPNTTGELK